MLCGVDDIDWAVLDRACHDPADDVPGRLRAIASSDADEAGEAREEVSGWIIHQGTVYPTTVAAVPYLVELADIPSRQIPSQGTDPVALTSDGHA